MEIPLAWYPTITAINYIYKHILGTNRGQADGFNLEILARLRDVKSKVCNVKSTTVLNILINFPLIESVVESVDRDINL